MDDQGNDEGIEDEENQNDEVIDDKGAVVDQDEVVDDEDKAISVDSIDWNNLEELVGDNPGDSSPSGDLGGVDLGAAGINAKTFDELRLENQRVEAARTAWSTFVNTCQSREAAGEAIYAALFEGAPSLQSLFTTPRAVQAMRFMNGLASFVNALDDPPKLKILVESLGFGHLHLDVTAPRVIIFRDAILDLFTVELAEKFTREARDGWLRLLNYVGGALIFTKAHYAERIAILLSSWKSANKSSDGVDMADDEEGATAHKEQTKEAEDSGKSRGVFGKIFKGGRSHAAAAENSGAGPSHAEGTMETTQQSQNMLNNVPTTYPEMFLFNAAVMGFGQSTWMNEVLACFHDVVTNVSNSQRLQEECDVLALRVHNQGRGLVNLTEYKSCMLASLRSLLPKEWSTKHEVAWTWLWENVERLLQTSPFFSQGSKLKTALTGLVNRLESDEELYFQVRASIYSRFFALCPVGQDYFKQSNTYLHIIAKKIVAMTLELYQSPVKMVDDISALGLRHVGYAIPTELFGPFVTACIEVVQMENSEEIVVEAFRNSLALVSKILVRTITEGSTIVMKAVNTNTMQKIRQALSCAPRGERAKWGLLVQVGTQTISPLAWSLESGNIEAAKAIIIDLLTIRADREKYYFGCDFLFGRHPDIVKRLREEAPTLMPVMFDHMIWRSRLVDAGLRRVNYYIKHLIMDKNGGPCRSLKSIAKTNNPHLACHPLIVVVSDILWRRIVWANFWKQKSLFLIMLWALTIDQAVLAWVDRGHQGKNLRTAVFVLRCVMHLSLGPPGVWFHSRESWSAYRNSKSGGTVRVGCLKIPRYLFEWQHCLSMIITLVSLVFLALEPILHCLSDNEVNGEAVLFTQDCSAGESVRVYYSICSSALIFLSWMLALDFACLDNTVAAYFLVCYRLIGDLFLFVLMSFCLILVVSCGISVLKQSEDQADFAGIHEGAHTIVSIMFGMVSERRYQELKKAEIAFAVVMCFYIAGNIYLVSLLIAQLSYVCGAVHSDMVGFARLNRISLINDALPTIQRKKWDRVMASLKLDQKIEFNPGDIGFAGGIPDTEPAGANPTNIDQIRRFGGSTNQSLPWPQDDSANSDEGTDRFERLEKLVQKALQRISRDTSSRRDSSSGGGGGTQQSASSSNSGAEAENQEVDD